MNNILSKTNTTGRYFFYGLFFLIVVLALRVMSPFFGTITLAVLTSLLFQPVYQWLFRWTRERARLATGLSMVVVVISFLLPLIFIIQLTFQQTIQFYDDIKELSESRDLTLQTVVNELNSTLDRFNLGYYGIELEEAQKFIENTVSAGIRVVLDALVRTGASSIEIVAHLAVYFFLLYFIFPIQARIPKVISDYSPLDNSIDQLFLTKIFEMSKSMIKGTFVISALQSMIGGIILYLFGVSYVVFWVMLMFFLGIIPLVGPSLVMIPMGAVFILMGNVFQGIFVILFTVLVMGNIDALLRPQLVSKKAELNPVLVLMGVLGGLRVFGVMGVIYGPVIMIILITMLEVYKEMNSIEELT